MAEKGESYPKNRIFKTQIKKMPLALPIGEIFLKTFKFFALMPIIILPEQAKAKF